MEIVAVPVAVPGQYGLVKEVLQVGGTYVFSSAPISGVDVLLPAWLSKSTAIPPAGVPVLFNAPFV